MTAASAADPPPPSWKSCLNQPLAWYAGNTAIRIADNVLLYQRHNGGWPKNIDMATVLTVEDKAAIAAQKQHIDTTIDNGATYTQLAYLAHVYDAAHQERFKTAFLKGLDYLLHAQYANGGWPQYYPQASGYHKHITFNDDAMIGVLRLLRDISHSASPYIFVDEKRRTEASRAVQLGIHCILKCQVRVDGKRTVWCAQHDEITLQPASARSYEKVSLSGSESVNIVRFLMGIESPDPPVIEAIQSTIEWFERVKLAGIKQIRKPEASLPQGYDKVIIADPKGEPLWARFYEIGTNRPLFCGRDGVIKYSLAEIEHERRIGYAWYVTSPARLLTVEYSVWKSRYLTKPLAR